MTVPRACLMQFLLFHPSNLSAKMNTVTVVALVLAFVFVQAAEIPEEHMKTIMGYHKECKAETNIDDNLATGLLTGQFPEDPVLKQHMFCMSKKLGIQNDAGEIQKEAVKAKISKVLSDEEKINELTESCSVEKGSPEDTAFELAKCVYHATH